ncbi:hypothetical protein R1sor_015252 [Riccia sorocarpa]|uniref:Uncharacterized protein n=1 Tax=Riccia sorocarpa TaxID=122646 RepID=A0ABD3HC69_9MARC
MSSQKYNQGYDATAQKTEQAKDAAGSAYDRPHRPQERRRRRPSSTVGAIQNKASQTLGAAKNTAGDASQTASDKAVQGKDYAVDSAVQAKDYTVDSAISAKDTTLNTATQAKDYTVDQATRGKDYAVDSAASAGQTTTDYAVAAKDKTASTLQQLVDNTRRLDFLLGDSTLKEGHDLLSGLDEGVLKIIDACKQLSNITRTSFGPNGMNMMVIHHLEKLLATSDSETMVNELEAQHHAANLVVRAARAQCENVGDGANLVVSFAGELLQNAEKLMRMGLHPSEIIAGYSKALVAGLEALEAIIEPNTNDADMKNEEEAMKRLIPVVASKQYGLEEPLCRLIIEACIRVSPKNPVNNVRVTKLLGGGVFDSSVVPGEVLKADAVGSIKKAAKAKIAVFRAGVDLAATKTKGTVLIKSAEQLESYKKRRRLEEAKIESLMKEVATSGATVIVSGDPVGEMALRFCERKKIMVLKSASKFELGSFCGATGASSVVKLHLGFADSISVEEIGGTRITVIKKESRGNMIATIVIRGSTYSVLDDCKRAVHDGLNAYDTACRDSRLVPGAGAAEIEVARRLQDLGSKETGLNQYAILKFAESLEIVPRILAENAGLNTLDVLSALHAAHASGNIHAGVDIEGTQSTKDDIWDLYITKFWALKLATHAVCKVLRVRVAAKQAGGPKPRTGPGSQWGGRRLPVGRRVMLFFAFIASKITDRLSNLCANV